MKKLFTLALALLGFAGAANAATTDDLAVCKHSYLLVCDEVTNNGTVKPAKNTLVGDGFILLFGSDANKSVATNKGSVDLSNVDGELVTEDIAAKYGEYGSHLNSLRLKNLQDMFVMKLTAKSKLIIFFNGQNKTGTGARYPKIATDEKLEKALNDAPTADTPAIGVSRLEFVVPDDGTYYVGSYNGDIYVSYIIVEANEAPGTPTVKVSDMQYDGSLYFKEVTCKANFATEEGSTERIPTVVTYTTDGTMPTAASPVYTNPIKCTKEMTVKFQAFLNAGDGKPNDALICEGADNEGIVSFSFDAPAINNEAGNVTLSTGYHNATNFYSYGEVKDAQGDSFTLTEAATVTAYTKIANGETTFTSKSSTKDIYTGLLAAVKEKKTITVTEGDVVVDEEATASSTTGTIYKVDNMKISADSKDFFVKNLSSGVVKDEKYQVPAGNERYIKMSDTNITFMVAAGEKVKVKVVCSKNSCKNMDAEDAAEDKLDNGCTPDRQCYVNVSGTNYCLTDAEGKHTNDLKLYPDANVFEFELAGGKNVTSKDEEGNETTTFEAADTYYTFQKYSGTGNILISSIEIEPVAAAPAETETVLWEGSVLVNGWADQPYLLSDGGKELTDNDAQVGDRLRFYCSAPDDGWQLELTGGHWNGMYFRYAPKDQGPEADGSARAYEIVDISKGYFDFVITDEFMTKAKETQGWGGVFVLNGDGNLTVTKLTLVKGGATGIEAVKSLKVVNKGIFNLAGQRVGANYKGVVIVNGKKMIQK